MLLLYTSAFVAGIWVFAGREAAETEDWLVVVGKDVYTRSWGTLLVFALGLLTGIGLAESWSLWKAAEQRRNRRRLREERLRNPRPRRPRPNPIYLLFFRDLFIALR